MSEWVVEGGKEGALDWNVCAKERIGMRSTRRNQKVVQFLPNSRVAAAAMLLLKW